MPHPRAARPADGAAMPRHVTGFAARPCSERTQRQCSARAVISERDTWRRLWMLLDVEFKVAPQGGGEKLPVQPSLDAVALTQRGRAPSSWPAARHAAQDRIVRSRHRN